ISPDTSPTAGTSIWRMGSFIAVQNPQLRRPIRKRQAKSLKVRVPRADLRLDCRKLLVAPFNSGRILQPPRRYIVEGPAAIEKRFLTCVLLPAPDNHVAVPRLQFNQPRLPSRLLTRDQRRTGPAEDIENGVPSLAAVAERPLDQFHRLHRRMFEVRHGPLDGPHVALITCTAPEVIRSVAPPIEDRLVHPLVVRTAQREMVLRPNHERRPVAPSVRECPEERVQFR